MKNGVITFLIFIISWLKISAQDTLIMPVAGNGGIYNSCYALIYDNGIDSNYKNYSHSTITIAPLWVQKVNLFFEEFETENFFDRLTIYDGPGITYPIIGTYSGTSLQGQTIYSTGNAITLEFRSDDIQTGTGFKAVVDCLMSMEENISNLISIYPSPVQNTFTIKGVDLNLVESLTLRDISGRYISLFINTTNLNVENLVPGLYYLCVTNRNGKSYYVKFMKE